MAHMDITGADEAEDFDMAVFAARMRSLRRHWVAIAAALALGGAAGYAASYGFTPTFVASTLFIPPQQQQSSGAAAALASLGALTGLMGGGGKSSADEYVSMLQSVTVTDDIIKRYDLMKVYDVKFKDEARKKVGQRVQVSVGKKDGMIRVDAEDVDPNRAASMANQYVEELRTMTSRLAVTEAQQRRVLFERLLATTKQQLVTAQVALEASGFSAGALKTEPRAAADTYAKLRADLTAAEVRLQVARGSLADTAPAVVQEQSRVQALGEQLSRLEASESSTNGSADYIGKYREFKYQETLFDLYSKQYELARLDEAREGALVQVVDPAEPAERKHFPRRSLFALLGGLLAALAVAARVWWRAPPPATAPR